MNTPMDTDQKKTLANGASRRQLMTAATLAIAAFAAPAQAQAVSKVLEAAVGTDATRSSPSVDELHLTSPPEMI